MRKQKTIYLLLLVVTVLVMGIAYAAISNVTLNVSGSAIASSSQDNFRVAFTGTPTVSGKGTTKAQITGTTTAIINVSGLTAIGDSTTVKFNIRNSSGDLNAMLSTSVLNSNTEYFTVTRSLTKASIGPSEMTTLQVTIRLNKTIIASDESTRIVVNVVANPYYNS